MKKKKKTKNNAANGIPPCGDRVVMLMSILVLLIIVLYIYSQISQQPPKQTLRIGGQVNNYQTQIPVNDRWYHSPLLKFSIMVPAGYTIEDKLSTVTLIKNNEKITISRNGTNYQTLEEYLKNSDSKLDLKIEQENNLTLNELTAIKRIESFAKGPTNRHKIYFISKNSAIYHISTNAESLFFDLDRIAQSFQYIP